MVTTSHNPSRDQIDLAKDLAKRLNTKYVNRRHLSDYKKKEKVDFYYVVESDGRIVIRWSDGELFFHPSVAKIRMKNIQNGGRDYLIEALSLDGDEVVLDTTFGLGTEAILIAAFLPRGRVVGIEKSIHIYTVVSDGMKRYKPKVKWIGEALKRIDLTHADMKKFIREAEDDSYDIVYCDPMFENPKYESSSMNPLRPFASYDTVNEDDVKHMLRIARKRVVLKANEKDSLFERIRVDKIMGSKKSGVLYGVIEKR